MTVDFTGRLLFIVDNSVSGWTDQLDHLLGKFGRIWNT